VCAVDAGITCYAHESLHCSNGCKHNRGYIQRPKHVAHYLRYYTLKPRDFRRPRARSNCEFKDELYNPPPKVARVPFVPWRSCMASYVCEVLCFDERLSRTKTNINRPPPKCLTASRVFLLPLSKTVFEPVGALKASWSSVSTSPPALRMRSFALRVKRRAATESFGTSSIRSSSVTVPTATTIFEDKSETLQVSLTILESEMGGLLILERKRR
jgi:hypothetical protein